MKIESSLTGRQFRLYGGPDDQDYVGSFNVMVRGPRAHIDSLISKEFYKNFDMIFEFVNVHCNTSIWHCHVVDRHYLAVQRMIGKKYNIHIVAREMNAGREMLYLEVTKR